MTRTYTRVTHDGAVIWIDGRRWIIDSVDVHKGHPGCEDDAVAYLSPLDPLPYP